MLCKKCGTRNIDIARYCEHCGTVLTKPASRPTKKAADEEESNVPTSLIAAVVTVILVVAAIFVALMLVKS